MGEVTTCLPHHVGYAYVWVCVCVLLYCWLLTGYDTEWGDHHPALKEIHGGAEERWTIHVIHQDKECCINKTITMAVEWLNGA